MRSSTIGSECDFLDNRWLWPRKAGATICAIMSDRPTPAANSWRTRPSRPRVSSRSRASACDLSWPAVLLLTGHHAQAPAVLDDSRTLTQGDGRVGPAFTRRAIGGERNLIVLDAGDVLHDAFAVRGRRIDAEGEVSPRCGKARQRLDDQREAASEVIARTAVEPH